jgi:phospholipase C
MLNPMRRRDFLRAAGVVGGAALLAGTGLVGCDDDGGGTDFESILDQPARECPIDTVVVLMMENRSFDHYLGWLSSDEQYLDAGRRRYGHDFKVSAKNDVAYPDRLGEPVETYRLVGAPSQPNPWRGCHHPNPGHGWFAGRAQLNGGFLAPGSGNDEYALGYYAAEDLAVHAQLARRFTVCDRYFASLLGGTFPNRQYMHAASSNGNRFDPGPLRIGIYPQPTIWDKLAAAQVETGFYYAGFPGLMLFGERMESYIRPIDRYFEDCQAGTLPSYTFIEPSFGGGLRTDDHPRGDVNVGQRFILECFGAFAQSSQWKRGLFILNYDEWGGFFDHAQPPVVPDIRQSPIQADNFGQLGFRVPAVLASPFARRGFVDHRIYDHSSVLRFLEWRFLGAPSDGPGPKSASRSAKHEWWITTRDHFARNIGFSLLPKREKADLGIDLGMELPQPSNVCPEDGALRQLLGLPPETEPNSDERSDPFELSPEFEEQTRTRFPLPTLTPWLERKGPFPGRVTPQPGETPATTAPTTPTTTTTTSR